MQERKNEKKKKIMYLLNSLRWYDTCVKRQQRYNYNSSKLNDKDIVKHFYFLEKIEPAKLSEDKIYKTKSTTSTNSQQNCVCAMCKFYLVFR